MVQGRLLFTVSVLAVLLVSATAPAADASDTPYTGSDIRQVDFRNGFTYDATTFGTVTVWRGVGRASANYGGDRRVTVAAVRYGDLTGGPEPEAAVELQFSDGEVETGEVRVFGMESGAPVDLGGTWTASRSDVADFFIANRVLVTDTFVATAAPDDLTLERTRWISHDGWLTAPEVYPARTWLRLGDSGATQLRLRPGTNSAVVDVDPAGGRRFSFDGTGGQTLLLTARYGDVSVVIWDRTGQPVGRIAAGTDLTLPRDGSYQALVMFDSLEPHEASFDLAIGQRRALFAPEWVPRVEHTIEGIHQQRETQVQWPVLTAASGAADLAAANASIERFVFDLRQDHLDAVADCEPEAEAWYRLTYRMVLVSYDLVTIEFDEWACECRSADTNRQFSLTVDLNTGRPVELHYDDLGEIVDPALRMRAASGAGVVLPAELYCGC